MGITYEEMMSKIRSNKGNTLARYRTHKWNYEEPYKMMFTEVKEQENGRLQITVGFKVDDEFLEKNFLFIAEGSGSYYYEQFMEKAFPGASEEMPFDVFLGRPFSAEIIKKDGYDNLHVLSGYKGEYPEEAEGLE